MPALSDARYYLLPQLHEAGTDAAAGSNKHCAPKSRILCSAAICAAAKRRPLGCLNYPRYRRHNPLVRRQAAFALIKILTPYHQRNRKTEETMCEICIIIAIIGVICAIAAFFSGKACKSKSDNE